MNSPRSNYIFATLKKHQLLAIILVVLLGTALLVLSSSNAQHRASKESKRTAKTKKTTTSAAEKADLARLSNRPFNLMLRRQDPGEALQPISSPAVKFVESRPLSQVAKKQTRVDRNESDEEEREAAENRAIRHVTPQALADASVADGLSRDTVIQKTCPAAICRCL